MDVNTIAVNGYRRGASSERGWGNNDGGGPAAPERVAGSRRTGTKGRAMWVRSFTEESFVSDFRTRSAVTSGTRMAQPLVPSGPSRPSGRLGHPTAFSRTQSLAHPRLTDAPLHEPGHRLDVTGDVPGQLASGKLTLAAFGHRHSDAGERLSRRTQSAPSPPTPLPRGERGAG